MKEFSEGMRNFDITVVVVTFNRATLLRQTLKTLVNQDTHGEFSFEILVIDDGSTDDTKKVVAEMAREVEPLRVRYMYKKGGGEGDARNRGVAEAHGAWVAFCDDDQLADPGWLEELYNAAQAKKAQCVGGSVALLVPDAGRLKLGPLARQFFGEKWLRPNTASSTAKNQLGAGNLLVHRTVFAKVGGFDPAFQQGVDTDFFWRVERAGFFLNTAPKALIYHIIPKSRLQLGYLRSVCLRKGVATQHIQWKYEGPAKVLLGMLKRLGIALAVDFPLLLLGVMFNDDSLALSFRCRLWYKLGFARGALFAFAPQVFPQKQFFQKLNSGYHGANRQCA